MYTFVKYLTVFLQIFIVFFLLICFILKKKLFNQQYHLSFESNIIWGLILISFISLIINFFLPLNMAVNSVIFILISFYFIFEGYFDQNRKKLIKNSILVTCLS